MSKLVFRVKGFPYEEHPLMGARHFPARLTREKTDRMGFPLFTLDRMVLTSGSSFMDTSASRAMVDELNPHLPDLPDDARFVVAGQQPGLLTGPLYSFLKAVSAIALAERISAEGGPPVRPLFWVASEDHDILEVNRVFVGGSAFVHPYHGEIRRGMVPEVGEISIQEARAPLLEFLRGALPMTEFTPWILDAVASVDYSSYHTAFEGLMRDLFDGYALRLVFPKALRPLTGPVLADLVENWTRVAAGLEKGTDHLRRFGFEPPLENARFFKIVEGRRVPARILEGTLRIEEEELSFKEAADLIRSSPEMFSPGAVFRPILQDAVLPVLVTIGGPTELLYLWQIRPIYDALGVTPSLLLPRISATFVEAKIRGAAEKAGLPEERLFGIRSLLEGDGMTEVDEPEIDEIEKNARILMESLDRIAGDVGPRWLTRSRDALGAQAEKIIRRLRKEKLAALGLDRSRLEKIEAALLPRGKPQERGENVMHFLSRYGRDFVRLSVEKLDPLCTMHQVVFLDTDEEED